MDDEDIIDKLLEKWAQSSSHRDVEPIIDYYTEFNGREVIVYIFTDPPLRDLKFSVHKNKWLLEVEYKSKVKIIKLPYAVDPKTMNVKFYNGVYMIKFIYDK